MEPVGYSDRFVRFPEESRYGLVSTSSLISSIRVVSQSCPFASSLEDPASKCEVTFEEAMVFTRTQLFQDLQQVGGRGEASWQGGFAWKLEVRLEELGNV